MVFRCCESRASCILLLTHEFLRCHGPARFRSYARVALRNGYDPRAARISLFPANRDGCGALDPPPLHRGALQTAYAGPPLGRALSSRPELCSTDATTV